MGLKMPYALVLDSEVTDTSLPILYPDPGMSPGTLVLVDTGHSESGLTAGVVPTSGTLRNLARDVAVSVIGSGVAADMDLPIGFYQTAGNASFRVERTGKGGIHGISSQIGQANGNNDSWALSPASTSALAQHLVNLVPGGNLFVSQWIRKTRNKTGAQTYSSATTYFANSTAATSNYLWHSQSGEMAVGQLGKTGSAQTAALGDPVLIAAGINAWQGTKPSGAVGTFSAAVACLGRFGPWASILQNKDHSMILYRLKIEDLSKTKRANNGAGGTPAEEYAAALAAEQALFTTAFGAGGKFNGDTWSDPATLLP